MKKRFLKTLVWVAGTVLSLAVCIMIVGALFLSWLGNDSGRSWIAGQIEQYIASEDYKIKIDDIETFNNRQISLSGMTLSDKEGAFIRLENITLDYIAEALLAGRIEIANLEFGTLEVLRLPEKRDGKFAQEKKQILLSDIPHLRIDHFRIETINLPATVSGEAQTLSLEGKFVLFPEFADSAAEIHLQDKLSGQRIADLSLSFDEREDVLLNVHIEDKGNGLITGLTGLSSLIVDLEGSGTEDKWQGNLSLDAGEMLHSENKVTFDFGNIEKSITLEGKSRYKNFSAGGKTILVLNPKTEKLALDFFGMLQTPDIILNDFQVRANIETDQNIFSGIRPSSVKMILLGKTGTVLDGQTKSPIEALAQADFEASAIVQKDKIQIEKSIFKAPLFETLVQGEIGVLNPTLELTAQTSISDLGMLEPDVSGALQIGMKLEGRYKPLVLEIPLEVRADDFSALWPETAALLGKTPVISANLSYADSQLSITDGLLRGHDMEKLDFSGIIKDGQADLSLATTYRDYDLGTKLHIKDSILTFSDFVAHGAAVDLGGNGIYKLSDQNLRASLILQRDEETSVSLVLSGSFETLSGKGVIKGTGDFPYKFDYAGTWHQSEVRLNNFDGAHGFNKITLQNPATLVFTDHGAFLKNMTIGLDDGIVRATGLFNAKTFEVDIVAENMPANLAKPPFLFDGRIDGKIALSGLYKNPQGNAHFTLKHIALPVLREMQDRYVDGTVTATYKESVLQAKADLQGPADLRFKAEGRLPLIILPLAIPFDRPVQGTLSSTVDLRALTILLGLDEQRLSGDTALDVTVSGTLGNPVIKGTGTLRNAACENILTGTDLEDIVVDISIDGDTLTLTNLAGKDRNGGRFTGSGQVNFKNIQNPAYGFSLDIERLQLINLDEMGLMASGNLIAEGNKGRADVKGIVVVNNAEYYIGEIIKTGSLDSFEIIETNDSNMSSVAVEQKRTRWPEINFAIHVNAKNNIFVRSPDLETEWGSKLEISGTIEKPTLKGNMTLVRGQFQLLDTPVILSKGTLRFINPDPENPSLDVTGTIKGQEMDALLKIKGDAQKPEISLTSEPPLPEDEILAKTLFGKSLNQISPMQALHIARLMASLSGYKGVAGFNPLDKIRRTIGIDTLSVGLDEEKGATLSAGKYINDRVYIGVDQGATPGSSAVRAEIEVRKNIDIETVTESSGESSVGVNWKRDY
ncbi:MAG: hypothetical protein CO093_03385 [Alphaproteobacteria bacterium CG_4_9_14_3_um_filter_47_13]|nr:MAG: hypothetical protein CO093_03385 [Alphaproteobacteria bacterium CG_4_9_14_3_um_filter_47_13]